MRNLETPKLKIEQLGDEISEGINNGPVRTSEEWIERYWGEAKIDK